MYSASSSTGLYGTVPFLTSHSPNNSVGVLSMMSSEAWVDVAHTTSGVPTHWFAESGVLDTFILLGPNPSTISQLYARLTGPSPLPPLFSIGHHQCRWNYDNQADLLGVNAGFEKADIPMDVLWLDVDWAKGKRYFEWDKEEFPDPMGMIKELEDCGRKVGHISLVL